MEESVKVVDKSNQVSLTDSTIKVNKNETPKISVKSKVIYSLIVAATAATLLAVDHMLAPIFSVGASFAWISFINWTVFTASSGIERIKAVVGYIVGYVLANGMIILGNIFENFMNTSSFFLPVGAILSVFIFNFLIMQYGTSKKLFNSISGLFLGMSLTFSGLGIKMAANNLVTLTIIVTYGIVGLLCCTGIDFFSKKLINAEYH
ncbi:MAG: DUF1097 domain-containing protein [Firmicutes bacterium]|nr:DUF1097 domain-containing protein [Bacillota bacterium]